MRIASITIRCMPNFTCLNSSLHCLFKVCLFVVFYEPIFNDLSFSLKVEAVLVDLQVLMVTGFVKISPVAQFLGSFIFAILKYIYF
jgi:hypothetical protein